MWCEQGLTAIHADERVVGKLSSPANFARFFLHELLPDLHVVLYVDVDIVLRADIAELWRTARRALVSTVDGEAQTNLAHGSPLLAAVARNLPLAHFFPESNQHLHDLFRKRYGRRLDTSRRVCVCVCVQCHTWVSITLSLCVSSCSFVSICCEIRHVFAQFQDRKGDMH